MTTTIRPPARLHALTTILAMGVLVTLCLAILPAASSAITYTDDSDAEFQTGTLASVNATANTLILTSNGTDYTASGTFTSRVLDMGQNPAITIAWNFTTPAGTSVIVQTRSGASTDVLDGTWSAYSAAYATSAGSTVISPLQRYLQYRISLGTTNTTLTPTVTAVTVNSTERPTTIALNNGSYTNLTSNQFGTNYTYPITATDTYTITSVTGRTRINASGSWTNETNLTPTGGASYTLAIPPPGGSWYALRGSTLFIDVIVNVTNGSVNTSTNRTFTEAIEFVSTPPVIDPIGNVTVAQGQNLTIGITATDFDNHTLTWSVTHGTITSTGNRSATFAWAPNATQTGPITVTVTANDGFVNATRSFTVNVTDTNDNPTLDPVTAITGHYGIRQLLVLSAFDFDYTQNITFTVSPSFFRITTSNVTPGGNNTTAVPGRWYGIANFTPLDDERGANTLVFTVSDGTATASVNTTMTITYCGDAVCQATYEDATTCPADCVDDTPLPGIAIVIPDRNCANTTSTLRFYDARDRYTCYNDGLVAGDRAVCDGLDGVAVAFYTVDGLALTAAGTGTSGTNGTLAFTPATPGQYRIVATASGYVNATATVMVRSCDSDIVIEETNTVVEQTERPPTTPPRPPAPRDEEPTTVEEQASVLVLLFIYVITPVLLASLLYFGNVFYDVNKDTLPWLLELRIKAFELRRRMDPTIQKVRAALKPVTNPLKALADRTVVPYVWQPVKRALQPLLDRMNESLKKDGKPPTPKN